MIVGQVSLFENYTCQRHAVSIFNKDVCAGQEAEYLTAKVALSGVTKQENTRLDGGTLCYFGRTEHFVDSFLGIFSSNQYEPLQKVIKLSK